MTISTRNARKLRAYVLDKRRVKREWLEYERLRAEAIAASSNGWHPTPSEEVTPARLAHIDICPACHARYIGGS